jgi:xanthine dehydrogenase accessory factor
MRRDLLILAADLARREEPFVLATVLRRQPASSAQPGDAAIITPDGGFHGWLGGSCTRPTVVREAMRALSDGAQRLISLSPDPGADRRDGVEVFPMTCHSGGSVDISIEPVMPPRRLVIFGSSPVARALSRLGKAMGYGVAVADPEADREAFPEADHLWTGAPALEAGAAARAAAVVATMGERDEDATLAALAMSPAYLGVVASRKRFGQIRETLAARGATPESLDRIQSPAGLDIGARTPEEIAVSILAGIVQALRADVRSLPAVAGRRLPQPLEELDPVCGMTVDVAGAKHRADVAGRSFYFCCAGCRDRFAADPQRYLGALASGATP